MPPSDFYLPHPPHWTRHDRKLPIARRSSHRLGFTEERVAADWLEPLALPPLLPG